MQSPSPRPAWSSLALRETLLGAPGHGQVRWSTPTACYAQVRTRGRDRLVALLRPGAVRVPMGIVVDPPSLPAPGTEVFVGTGIVGFGDRAWRPTRWWDPHPRVSASGLLAHRDALERAVRARPSDGFGLPLNEEIAVASAIARGDAQAAHAVIGLGPGLTPSGDDVVAGALVTLALLAKLDPRVAHTVLELAREHTTALSSALLEAAAKGELIPQAAHLLEAIAAAAPQPQIDARAADLFAVGAHSGHDLAAGILGALVSAS